MRTSYLNPTIYNRIYGVMQYPNALALRVSLETGLRIDDVLSLRPSDLTGQTVRGIAEKTDKPFRKVLSRDLSQRLRQISGKYFIFEHRTDPKKHRTRQTVWKDVKKAVNILHISGNIAPHSARKTYAVELFRDSGINEVQKELQHDRLSTTMLYAFADVLDGKNENKTNVRECPLISADFLDDFAEIVAKKIAQRLVR
jgi:integrase